MTSPTAGPEVHLTSMRVIVAGAMGTLIVLGFILPLMGLDEPVPPFVASGLLGLNVLAFAAAELFGYSTPAAPAGDPEAARRLGVAQLQTTTVRRMAMTEAPGILAVAAAFVTGSAAVYLFGAVPALAFLAWHAWPSRRTVGRLERSLDRDGGRSRLTELLDGASIPGYQQY